MDDDLAKANKKTEERMRRLMELSKEPGAPNSLSSMNLRLSMKPQPTKSISGAAGKRKASRRWSRVKTLKSHAAGEWGKVVTEARSKLPKRERKDMRRKLINDIEDMEYVPDPLTKRPADYYLPQPNVPWELQINPFNCCFKGGSVPVTKWIDFAFFSCNFLQAPVLGVFLFAGMTCRGFHDSVLSLRPEFPADYPPFENTVRPALLNSDLNSIGIGILSVTVITVIVTIVGCTAVYQGLSKLTVLYTVIMAAMLGLEWYFALYYVENSLCPNLSDLHGSIKHLVEQFWVHPHSHNRFGPHTVINALQLYLRCCGYDGPKDYLSIPRDPKIIRYPVPTSCCSPMWNRNIFCSNVGLLDKSNPEFENKINQQGCYSAVIKVCNLVMRVMTNWIWIAVIVHTCMFVGILVTVLLELSMLKTMLLSCHQIEFALRSYIIPDEPLVRRRGHRYGDKRDKDDLKPGHLSPPRPAKLPPEMQRRLDQIRKRYGVGKERYGLEVEESIRQELKAEAELMEELALIEDAAADLEQQRKEKEQGYVPGLADSRLLFSTGRYKFLLPLNDPMAQNILPRLMRNRKDYDNILLEKPIKLGDLDEESDDVPISDQSHHSGETGGGATKQELDEKALAKKEAKLAYEKDLAVYEAKQKERQQFRARVQQQNKWTWKKSGRGALIKNIPSDDDVKKMAKSKEIEQKPVEKPPEIIKMKTAKKFKKPPPRTKVLDPKEIFRQEDEARIQDIIEETKKQVANETSLMRRNFLQKVAEAKIAQIRNHEKEQRRIVILEDKLSKKFGTKARRRSIDISKVLTPTQIQSRLEEAEAIKQGERGN